MKQLGVAALRSLGMFLAVVGALLIEKSLDSIESASLVFGPFVFLAFGLMLFYSVRD